MSTNANKPAARPPAGIKRKDWLRKKHSGHAPSRAYGRHFGEQRCQNGHVTRSTFGAKPLEACPVCAVVLPRNGYVTAR